MAFLDATMLLDLQADNALNEKRFAELGVIDAVKASTSAIDFIDPSTIQAMHEMSSLRDAQIPVMKDQTVTVTSSPSFVIPAILEVCHLQVAVCSCAYKRSCVSSLVVHPDITPHFQEWKFHITY